MNAYRGTIVIVLALALAVPAMAQVDTGEYITLRSQFPAGTINWALGANVDVVGEGYWSPQNKDALVDGEMIYRELTFGAYYTTPIAPYVSDDDGRYVEGDYVQIDLGALVKIDTVTAAFAYDNNYRMYSGSFEIWLSKDGDAWYQVSLSTTPYISDIPVQENWDDTRRGEVIHPDYSRIGAVSYGFAEEEVRFVRLADFAPSNFGIGNASSQHCFFTEILVTGSVVVPEPATMSLLALGGLAMLRRRK